MLGEGLPQLNVELYNTIHSNRHRYTVNSRSLRFVSLRAAEEGVRESLKLTYPDVPEYRAIGALAISAEILRYHGSNSHSNSNEAVVIDADPDNVEPGQATLWCPPWTPFTSAASFEPIDWQHPGLYRLHQSKVFLLFVNIGCNVMAK